MRSDRVLTLALAIALAVGIGMAATTLGSSVDTTPDDVVDIEAASIPLGQDELAEYERQFKSGGETGEPASASTGDAGEGDPETGPGSGSGSEARGSTDGQGDRRDLKRGDGDRQVPVPGERSLLERLLELLRALLAALVELLPVLVALAALALVVANRDRLAALLEGHEAGSDGDDGDPPTRAAPSNDVSRAWYEMATLVGVEDLETTTPRQVGATAVEAGADRSAVDRLTGTFEEVRYGDGQVTERRRELAREALRRIRDGLGVSR